jgi:hypothetical protein
LVILFAKPPVMPEIAVAASQPAYQTPPDAQSTDHADATEGQSSDSPNAVAPSPNTANASSATDAATPARPDRVCLRVSLNQAYRHSSGLVPSWTNRQLGKLAGLPQSVVARNRDEVAARVLFEQNIPLLAKTPKLADWLSEPVNARNAHPDIPQLLKVSHALGDTTPEADATPAPSPSQPVLWYLGRTLCANIALGGGERRLWRNYFLPGAFTHDFDGATFLGNSLIGLALHGLSGV